MHTRFVLVALLAATGMLVGSTTACSSSPPPANSESGGTNGTANTSKTDPDPDPEKPAIVAMDEFDNKRDEFFMGLAEVLKARNIKTLAVRPVLIPSRNEIIEATMAPVATHSWSPERLASGHRGEYLGAKANQLRQYCNMLASRELVEVTADDRYDELDDLIWKATGVEYDPRFAAEIGRRVSAQAILFMRLKGAFVVKHPISLFRPSVYWVDGNYQLEAHLVLVERGTNIWFGGGSWKKVFTIQK